MIILVRQAVRTRCALSTLHPHKAVTCEHEPSEHLQNLEHAFGTLVIDAGDVNRFPAATDCDLDVLSA